MSLQLAEIDSKYEILGKLGEGGMGAVFKARHRLLDEMRVIKAILPLHQGDQDLQARFRREAQAATRLRHPNIAQVHDLLIDDEGTTHIVMEFIEGRTLQQALSEGGRPDLKTAVEIASQALEAVGYLHGKGYMHRDISPDNMMLTRGFDDRILVKLIDLGLAKRNAGSVGLTAPGTFMGKVRYAAPEHFANPGAEVDPRSDLYSFGVVLYELLTGQCPIRGESFAQMIACHLNHPVPDFEETDPSGRVPADLREVTLKALAKEPSDRIPSAELLLDALDPYREKTPGKSQYLEDLLAKVPEPKPVPVGSGFTLSSASATLLKTPSAGVATGSDRVDSTVGTLAAIRGDKTPLVGTDVAVGAEVADRSGAPATRLEPAGGASNKNIATWALAAVALIAVAVLGSRWLNFGSPPPPGDPGSLRLDAVPWAEIREIKNPEGQIQPLDGSKYTPVVLSLAPGTYQISLAHPDFSVRSVEVEVLASESVDHRVEFEPRAVDSYFEAVGLTARLEEAGL